MLFSPFFFQHHSIYLKPGNLHIFNPGISGVSSVFESCENALVELFVQSHSEFFKTAEFLCNSDVVGYQSGSDNVLIRISSKTKGKFSFYSFLIVIHKFQGRKPLLIHWEIFFFSGSK